MPAPPSHGDPDGVLVVSGDLDMATADDLGSRLERAIADQAGAVVVDTSGVSFVDCSGLRPLLAAEERLASRGRHLRLVAPSASVLHLLRWAGTEELLDLRDRS